MKKTQQKIFLSIIVPVFNESTRLKTLVYINGFLKRQKFFTELLVINDGSTDDTLTLLKNLQRKISFRIISYNSNMGKGYAIKKGMLSAKGKYRLFTDIDLSTPLNEFKKFFPLLSKYDVLIGSRRLNRSRILIHQPFARENLGRCFTWLSQRVLNLYFADFTCGFKCFSKKAAISIFSKQNINRWGFDSEILFIANKRGFSIKEVPVSWRNDESSKVKFPQDIITSLGELVKIKTNNLKRLYE